MMAPYIIGDGSIANSDKKTTLNAMDKDLSRTSMHLRATNTLPMRPVLPKMMRMKKTMPKVRKTLPQSTGHHPEIDEILDHFRFRFFIKTNLQQLHRLEWIWFSAASLQWLPVMDNPRILKDLS